MKKIISLILFVITVFVYCDIIEEFHTRIEMETLIFSLENQYPEICDVIQIGESTPGPGELDSAPIYAVKISDNVSLDEDEPAVLYVGSVHAEELIGHEVVLEDLKQLLSQYENENSEERLIIDEMELWFVPMANPRGVDVVFAHDDSWRKNVRDNDLDGVLDFVPGYGNDRDGVDLNRNWDHHWVHGDTLYQTGSSLEQFDYYRGPAPNSENEVQALINLSNQQHFIYSIIWHTSRTTNFSEKLFFPFKYYDIDSRACPDIDITEDLGNKLANNISKLDNSGYYMCLPSGGRHGIATPYYYNEWGTIHFTIETSSHRPNAEDLNSIIDYCVNGERWLTKRAMNGLLIDCPMLTGHVTDSQTGEPLVAEVKVNERHADYFTPRKSDSFGRYWRPLKTGSGQIYSVTFSKRGYSPLTRDNIILLSSSWTIKNAQLDPLPEAKIIGDINVPNGESVQVIISDGYKEEEITTTGSFEYETYGGYNIDITLRSPGSYPIRTSFVARSGNNILEAELTEETIIMSDNFDNNLDQWVVDGTWELIDELSVDGKAVTDSWGGKGFYVDSCDYRLTLANSVDLSETNSPVLTFDQSLYTEWDFDNFDVEVSTDGTNYERVYRDSGQKEDWKFVMIDLSGYKSSNFKFRFRLTDESPDGRLVDPGVTIDNVKIVDGASSITGNDNVIVPNKMVILNQNYPNPFNPLTKISFNYPGISVEKAHINIYNVLGQNILSKKLSEEQIKNKEFIWNAENMSSGIYFYQIKINNMDSGTKKAILLK